MIKKGIFGKIILIFILLILGFFWFINGYNSFEDLEEVSCVPSSCCHSTSCVLEEEAPDCEDIFCSQECKPGTLDCGQASCKYVNGNCEFVKK
tara:strand:+ start:20081 stop:20359 length:279 start_codon:yes stop_codon:yes gene_type:complete